MDEKAIKHLKEVLNILVPNNNIEIRAAEDLKETSDPAMRDLIDMAKLISRLSEEERA